MAEAPIMFFNGDNVGASPAQSKQTVNWIGNLRNAVLTVNFLGKFGWELKSVRLNRKEYTSARYRVTKDNPNLIVVDVKDALINGDNVLTVIYDAPFTGHLGDRTTLTASLALTVDGIVSNIPSLDNLGEQLDKRLANATVPTIAILAIIAAIAIAVAIIVAKLTGLKFLGELTP